ncbi:MAG TPA: hypothetical protein VGX00_02100 [Thermoplasmata archaeon]|nr:hypothetical protein [Thermoplasmata archaeon]
MGDPPLVGNGWAGSRRSVGFALRLAFTLALVAVALGPTLVATSEGAPAASGGSVATSARYGVTFTADGLSTGAVWNLTVQGGVWTTTNRSLTLLEANGSYSYSAYAPTGRGANGVPGGYVNGSFTVSGSPVAVHLIWNPQAQPPSAGSSGGGAAATSAVPIPFLSILIVVALVVTILAAGVAIAKRPRGPLPPIPQGPNMPPSDPSASVGPSPPAPTSDPADPLRHML